MGVDSYLIDDAKQIQLEWLNNKKNIGVTAGASAPEQLVQNIIQHIGRHGQINVKSLHTQDAHKDNQCTIQQIVQTMRNTPEQISKLC